MSTIFVWHSQYQLFGMDSKMTSSTEGPHRKKGHDRKSARTEQLLGSVRQFFGSCCLLKNPNFFVFWQKNVAERNWFLSFVQNILDLAKFVRCLLLGNRLSTFVSRCSLLLSFLLSFLLPFLLPSSSLRKWSIFASYSVSQIIRPTIMPQGNSPHTFYYRASMYLWLLLTKWHITWLKNFSQKPKTRIAPCPPPISGL